MKRLFGGLGAFIISLSIIAAFGTKLAFDREGDVNLALKIVAPTQTGDADTQFYKSDYQSKDEMYDALKAYNIQAQIEGTVLLKNKNNALPLKATDKVTLLGKASTNPVYHGGSGGPSAARTTSLVDAIKEGGYSFNESVSNAVKAVDINHDKYGNIGEVPVSTYNGVSASFANYKDAAIVVLKRFGGEEGDLNHGLQGLWEKGPEIRELALHDEEKDVLNLVKNSSFSKRIVVINSGYPMELEELDNYDIDAVLWIGYPGSYGMYGVSDVLFGKADPSGRLVDTYASNSLSSAAMQNAGDFTFTNLSTLYKNKYLIYAEGIYVGYKYYETRYNDCILNQYNADNAKGIYNSQGGKWNYADEVTYSFGDGMSYANFSQEIVSFEWNRETHNVTAKVRVTNNGGNENYTGKSEDVVQMYVQLPYEVGQAEKSAIQIVDFEKTHELAVGESEEVVLSFSDYNFATYDENAVNGEDNTKTGCYTFDAGKYYFAIGSGAHDALNNVLAKQNKTGMYDANNNPVAGDVNKVKVEELAALDNTTYAKSPYTGELVSNLFSDRDINHFYDTDVVNYLTRSDWNTFPNSFTNIEATQEIKHLMEDSLYVKPADAPDYKSFKYKQDNGIEFIEMKDVPFDDPKWEDFIDELSVGELAQIVGDHMAMDKIGSINFPSYSGGDGPDGHQISNVLYVNEIVASSTFSKESLTNRGKFFGEESLWLGFKHIYGPGANIHRTPYSGRNFEYYSEDAMMSYLCGEAQEQGMVEKGIAGMIKHFCGNDQETNRHGVASFMSEQAYRQGALKGFEGALAHGSLGTMTAYNRIGCIPTAADYQTMTLVLRKEWGFKGINMTDSSKDAASYMSTADCLSAGTNQFNNDAGRVSEASALLSKNKDGYLWLKLRETAHYYLYAMSRSNLINGLKKDVAVADFVPWWKPTAISIVVTLGVIGTASIGMYVFLSIRKKKGE